MKRYLMAIVFLFLVVFLMLIGTFGVSQFADNMLEQTDKVHIQPRGEKLVL